jgi:deazaflavin-dependent oxidoreductase (nitroreductase family)
VAEWERTLSMTPTLRMTRTMRLGTTLLKGMLRAGVPMGPLALLSVRGRRSGKGYATPVALVKQGHERWLVAAFGEVNWVRNLRAAGVAHLIRGRHAESISVIELGPSAAAPILQRFLHAYYLVPFIPPYFGVTRQSPLEAFEQEAAHHPVFRIVPRKEV